MTPIELNNIIEKVIPYYAPYTKINNDVETKKLWIQDFGMYEAGLVNRAIKEVSADKDKINKFYQAPVQAIKDQIEIIKENARLEQSRIQGELESWGDPDFLRFLGSPKGMGGTTHYRMMSDYEIMYWVTFKLSEEEYKRDYHKYIFDRDDWHPISEWDKEKETKAREKRAKILAKMREGK